jgi:hypothetical protein
MPGGGTAGGPGVPSPQAGKANYLQLGLMGAQKEKIEAETAYTKDRQRMISAAAEISETLAEFISGLKGDTDIEQSTINNMQMLWNSLFGGASAAGTGLGNAAAGIARAFSGRENTNQKVAAMSAAVQRSIPSSAKEAESQTNAIRNAERQLADVKRDYEAAKKKGLDIRHGDWKRLIQQLEFELKILRQDANK